MLTGQVGGVALLLGCLLLIVSVEGYGDRPKSDGGLVLGRGARKLIHTPEELFEGRLLEGKKFEEIDNMCNATDVISAGITDVHAAVKCTMYKDRRKVLDGFDIEGLNNTFTYMCQPERRDDLRKLTECLNTKENKATMAKCRKKYYDDRVKNATSVRMNIENKCTWFRAIVYCAETATSEPACEKEAIELYKEITQSQLPVCDCNDKVFAMDDKDRIRCGALPCNVKDCINMMGTSMSEKVVQTRLLFGAENMDFIDWMCWHNPKSNTKTYRIRQKLDACLVKPDCFYLTKRNKFKRINVEGMMKAADSICDNIELIKNNSVGFMDDLITFTNCQAKKHDVIDQNVELGPKEKLCKKHSANMECFKTSMNNTTPEITDVLRGTLKMRTPDVCDCKPLGIDPRAVVAGTDHLALSSILAILIPLWIHRVIF